jgi:3-hydroxyisobutyrate dehydrogenase
MQIGLAGLGKMGAAVAQRLIEIGHQVSVWNRTADKTKPLADVGARVAATPADLAAGAEAVITLLTDAAAIDAVYNGPSGLLSGNVRGKLFIDMSTVAGKTEVALAEKVRAKDAAFVECPVGGSVTPARTGKLLGLMGAEPDDAERAKPILEQLCRRLEHCGPVGTGSSMKLAVNLPLMAAWKAYGEAFAICRDVGWDPKRLLDLFVDTNGANPALKMRADMVVSMFEGGDGGSTTFTIANCCKDLRTMLAEGKARGIDLPVIEQTLAGFEEANSQNWGARDAAFMAVYWPNRTKN